mgnify:CR=1 FL=1
MRSKKGFTLVEVMFVVLMIAMLLTIAVIAFSRPSTTSRSRACVMNLRQVATAKEQWAIENRKTSAEVPTWADLKGPGLYIKAPNSSGLICPMGGVYSLNNVETNPTCSLGATVSPEHVLPGDK